MNVDVAVVGGGMIGTAIAYGLAGRGLDTALLDEGDRAFRAARGNFGLVWVQGKGVDMPEYAAWTRHSADAWPELAAELEETTGVAVGHRRPGGLHLCYSDEEMAERERELRRLHNHSGIEWRYEMLDRKALADLLPGIGPAVVGASYSPADGHASPLYLLRALHAGFHQRGGRYLGDHPVRNITADAHGFRLETPRGPVTAGKLVLAAGLGNATLAPMVGMRQPVRPQRGQILVTEKVRPFLEMPTTYLRQTVEGSLMLGDSHEEVGFNDGTTAPVMQDIARRATTTFPFLRGIRVVRAWGALRVMSADGHPIYEQSPDYPGAFAATAHSGVTLAAAHAGRFAGFIAEGRLPDDFAVFGPERFDVSTTH